mgnify:CR=1 FL=1
MGKLLGLVLAVVGGFIAIHSLSTEEVQPASLKTAAAPSEPNIMQSVPAPMPATAERRRMEQRDKHANAKTESAKTETAPAPVVQQVLTATEAPDTPMATASLVRERRDRAAVRSSRSFAFGIGNPPSPVS